MRVTATGGRPRLRFTGRSGAVSDLVGEKLDENQLLDAFLKSGSRGFLVADPRRPGYDLGLEDEGKAAQIVHLLRRNSYFAQALRLGQLAPPRACRLPAGWLLKLPASLATRRGGRLGDVKLPLLISNSSPEEVEQWLA